MKKNEFFKIALPFIDDLVEDDLLEIGYTDETTDYLFGNFDDLLLLELYNKHKIPLAVVQDVSESDSSGYKIVKRDITLENYSFTCQLMDSIKFPKNSEYRLYVGFLITLDNE